jgi:Tol biopolymer transport system component
MLLRFLTFRGAGTTAAVLLFHLLLLATGPLAAQAAPDYSIRQLSPSGEPSSRVADPWAVDPRGEWVAFVGDVESAGAEAVYAMRRNGSDLHRLSPQGATGAITQIDFSPDGQRILYRGDLDVDGLGEIWSVAPWQSAAAAIKLSGAVAGAGVHYFRVPEVGNRFAYVAETAAGRQAWSVPFAGPSSLGVRLDPPALGDEVLLNVFFRPDGASVAIQFLDSVAFTARIFTVPAAGPATAAILISDETPGGCAPVAADFTPDSSRLLFGGYCPPGSTLTQLWSVPATGPAGAAVSLAGSFATGGAILGLAISPDSQRVVFNADRLVDERADLFSVPVSGPASAIVQLNPTLVANGDVKNSFKISPDSTRVAYIADQISDERYFPYSVPIDGPSAEAVALYQGILMTGADAQDLAFTPDSTRVVFRFDLAVDQRFDLYWAPADGSAVQSRITNRGSSPAPPRSVDFRWYIHPDGERVFYQFDEFAPNDGRGIGEQRLVGPYSADARLNGIPATGGSVSYFRLYPDGAGVVYRSDEVADGKDEIFTADLRLFGDGFEEGTTASWSDLP